MIDTSKITGVITTVFTIGYIVQLIIGIIALAITKMVYNKFYKGQV